MPPARKSKPRSPEHAALGNAIRQLREAKGLTIEGLADLIGTDLTQLGGVERGTRNATYEYLLRVAKSLGTSVGEMTTLADQLAAQDRG
jgi:transcriptional regulator with XRE-family HTH domain